MAGGCASQVGGTGGTVLQGEVVAAPASPGLAVLGGVDVDGAHTGDEAGVGCCGGAGERERGRAALVAEGAGPVEGEVSRAVASQRQEGDRIRRPHRDSLAGLRTRDVRDHLVRDREGPEVLRAEVCRAAEKGKRK